MSILSSIEHGLDRTIGIFSPASEIRRRIQRKGAEQARQYAAAKSNRSTGNWSPCGQDVNSLIRSSSVNVRNRTRQLVRDFAYFARAVDVLVDYTVGTGIQYQSRVTRGIDDAGKSKLNTRAIRQIEDAWQWWMEEADASGRLHYYELEQLAKRQDVESGQHLFVKVHLNDPKRFIPFAIMPYEVDWLTSNYTTVGAGNIVDQGVECEPITGRVVAYHFAVPNGFNNLTGGVKSQRILAENVIHGFKTLRPGQLTGISPFTTAILIADDLHEYLNAEIDGAKMAAKYLAIIETPDIAGFQGVRATAGDNGQMIESMENAIIEYTRPGEKVNFANHNRPGDSFEPFTRLILRMVAISTGVTYELLTGDYNNINYSNLRGIRNDFMKMVMPLQQRHIRQFSKPVFESFMESCYLSGKLNLPGYSANPRPWLAGHWQAPGVESIDPLREGKANLDQVGGLLKSPQEITSARGRDYEDVLNEIAEANRMADARGLSPAAVKTALASNPASISGEPAASATDTKPAKRDERMELAERAIDALANRETPVPAAPPVINITNNMPEQSPQPAPVVNVTNQNNLPEQLPQTAPIVNVTNQNNMPEQPALVVNNNIPPQAAPVIRNEITVQPAAAKEVTLKKDANGKVVGAEVK
jgi:lambda family phage portal protein